MALGPLAPSALMETTSASPLKVSASWWSFSTAPSWKLPLRGKPTPAPALVSATQPILDTIHAAIIPRPGGGVVNFAVFVGRLLALGRSFSGKDRSPARRRNPAQDSDLRKEPFGNPAPAPLPQWPRPNRRFETVP